MDAFTLATELLGDLKLTSGQLGQLRALDYRLLLERVRLEKLREAAGAPETGAAPSPSGAVDAVEELAALREMLVTEILEMLTPEQRASLGRD